MLGECHSRVSTLFCFAYISILSYFLISASDFQGLDSSGPIASFQGSLDGIFGESPVSPFRIYRENSQAVSFWVRKDAEIEVLRNHTLS